MIREDIDHFFMKIAFMYASRSTCFRRQVGSVIVRDKIQLSAGYNGSLPGMEHCIDNHELCIREKLHVPSGERQELCLTGDNVIKLLDGTYKTIEELSNVGENIWVYSIDVNTGKIIPGYAINPHFVGYRNDIVKITFDNGKSIKCTSDHKIMMRDCSYKLAKDLQYGESCMPIYYNEKINKHGEEQHEIVQNYRVGRNRVKIEKNWKYQHSEHTHQLVYRYVYNFNGKLGKNEYDIHHINENKRDNRPENLKLIKHSEHVGIHSKFKRISKEELLEYIKKSNDIRREKLKNDSEYRQHISEIGQKSMKKLWNNEEWKKKALKRCRENWKIGREKSNKDPEAILHRTQSNMIIGLSNVLFKASQNNEIVTIENYNELRRKYNPKNRLGEKGAKAGTLDKLIKYFGSFENAIEIAKNYNHKVVKIEFLNTYMPVYDMSVPDTENFAIDLGDNSCVVVHNCLAAHAEANAISKAAMNGINIKDATLYVTCKPCTNCTKMIISSGIKRLVYCGKYSNGIDDELTNSLITNIQVDTLNPNDFKDFIEFNNCIRNRRC